MVEAARSRAVVFAQLTLAVWVGTACGGTVTGGNDGGSGAPSGNASSAGSSTASSAGSSTASSAGSSNASSAGSSPGAAGTSPIGPMAAGSAGANGTAGGVGGAMSSAAAGASSDPGTLLCDGPCVPLTPSDGWISGSSNALMIQGAIFPFGDTTSTFDMVTDFTGNKACIRGSAARVDLTCTPVPPATDCYGFFFGAEIGLNLQQALDPTTMMGGVAMPFDAGALRGFAFDLSGNDLPPPKSLRFEVETNSQSFCNIPTAKLQAGRNVVLFSNLVVDCFRSPVPTAPTAETAKSMLTRISWHVITNISSEVPFDFCVSNLRALLE